MTSPENQTDSLAQPLLNRDGSQVVKAVALILMFVHHFFTIPRLWIDGIEYPFIEKIAFHFVYPTRICVPMFCFLTGYAYFFNKQKTLAYSLRKDSDILVGYWLIFFPFALLAVILTDFHYTGSVFIREMFALTYPSMFFCWYVHFYLVFMLLMPLYARTLTQNIHLNLLLALIVIPSALTIVQSKVCPHLPYSEVVVDSLRLWLPNVLIGTICAQHQLLDRLHRLYQKYVGKRKIGLVACALALLCLPMGRVVMPDFTISLHRIPRLGLILSFPISFDVVYTPLFILCLLILWQRFRWQPLQTVIFQLGKYSMMMWFIHCLFFGICKNIFQPVLYFPRHPLLVTIWGLFLCYLLAVPAQYLTNKLNALKNRYLFRSS